MYIYIIDCIDEDINTAKSALDILKRGIAVDHEDDVHRQINTS